MKATKRKTNHKQVGPAQQLALDITPIPDSWLPEPSAPFVLRTVPPAKTTAVYDAFWKFAAERQRVFFLRLRGNSMPWTDDPILRVFKFTNAYRASDRVSQYLISRVIYGDEAAHSPRDTFFRIILFKLFNKIETWELLERELGSVHWDTYSFRRYDGVLANAMQRGERIYSAAYIMPPGGKSFGESSKHRNHLRLLELMIEDRVPERLAQLSNMKDAFDLLHSYPTVGDFLAYQYVTDLNYSDLTSFTEMEFVIPGPGARDGLRKCFADAGGLDEVGLIRMIVDNQEREFERFGLHFSDLWGRRLQLIDCQNLFCEIAKYARVAHPDVAGTTGRTRIKQRFTPLGRPARPFYPPKWGLNEFIAQELTARDGS